MSTPQSKFKRNMLTQRQSTNVEDRRRPADIAPDDAAGWQNDPNWKIGKNSSPDLNKPVPVDEYTMKGAGDAEIDRLRAKLAVTPSTKQRMFKKKY